MAKKKKAGSSIDPNAWMVTFSDLVTLMLTFFVLLLSMSSMDDQKADDIANAATGTVMTVIDSEDFSSMQMKVIPSVSLMAQLDKLSRKLYSADRELISRDEYQKYMWKWVQEVSGDDLPPTSLGGDEPGKIGMGLGDSQIVLAAIPGGIGIMLPESITFSKGNAEITEESQKILKTLGMVMKRYDLMAIIQGHTDEKPIYSSQYPSNWELSCARSAAVAQKIIDLSKVPAANLIAAGYGDTRPVADNATPEGRERNRRIEILLTPSPRTHREKISPLHIPKCPFCPADPEDLIFTGSKT